MRRNIRVLSGLVLVLAVAAPGCFDLEWKDTCDTLECAWVCSRAGYESGTCSDNGCGCFGTQDADADSDSDLDGDVDSDADVDGDLDADLDEEVPDWECIDRADCEGNPRGHDCQSSIDPDTGRELRRCGCSGGDDCIGLIAGPRCRVSHVEGTPYDGLSYCGCIMDDDCGANRFSKICSPDMALGAMVCGGLGECLSDGDCAMNPTALGPECSPGHFCECDPSHGNADCEGNPNGRHCANLGTRHACSCNPGIPSDCLFSGSGGLACRKAPEDVETFVCQ